MKNILILGASGNIGSALYKQLSPYYNTYGTYFTKKSKNSNKIFFFSSSISTLKNILKKTDPKLIINALKGVSVDILNVQKKLVDYCLKNDCRLMLISGANVFDAFHNYPSYEHDKTLSESIYGRFQIKMESQMLKLPYIKKLIIRSPVVFGLKTKRMKEIEFKIEKKIPIEVFPNTIINFSSLNRLTQQIHFIINHKLSGIYHLGTDDLISHSELIEKIVSARYLIKMICKRVYVSNHVKYLALLSKKNRLPKHLHYNIDQGIKDLELIRKRI